MCRAGEAGAAGERISAQGFDTAGWQDAVVPGTVLTSLVENKVYPDPYYGINNKLSETANIFKYDTLHVFHFDVVTWTVAFSVFQVRCAVEVVTIELTRSATLMTGVVPTQPYFISAILTVNKSAEVSNIAI